MPKPSGRALSNFLLQWGRLLEAAPFPTVVVGLPAGEVRLANAAALAVLGERPRGLADLLTGDPVELIAQLEAAEGAVLANGELRVVGAALRDADTGTIDGALIGVGRGDAPGRPIDWRPVFGVMVATSDEAWFGVDELGRVDWANPTGMEWFGELRGAFLAGALPSAALVAVTTGSGGLQRVVTRDHEARVLQWRATSGVFGGQKLRGLAARDVTATHDAALDVHVRLRRVEALNGIALSMSRGLPVVRLARDALARLEGLIPMREGRVCIIDGDVFRVVAAWRDGAPLTIDTPIVRSTTPADVAVARLGSVQRGLPAREWPATRALEPLGMRAGLFAPMRAEEAILGVVEVYTDLRDAFFDDEVALVESIAGVLAAAHVRERVMEQVARHASVMEQNAARRHEELHRTNEQLVHAAKLSSIGELAAGLVHELNQPLNVISGYVELLAEGSLSESARTRAMDVMARAVQRMVSMVDHLRNFSRAGEARSERVDLLEVCRMARELSVGALERGVEVVGPSGLAVWGDSVRLEQVVVNLIANALQAGGDPVTVRVSALGASAVTVDVADRGPGVPPTIRDRIFDAFYTTKPPGQGTGLGLSVTARIVRDHGGRVEVHDNPGGGAIFRVILPSGGAADDRT